MRKILVKAQSSWRSYFQNLQIPLVAADGQYWPWFVYLTMEALLDPVAEEEPSDQRVSSFRGYARQRRLGIP